MVLPRPGSGCDATTVPPRAVTSLASVDQQDRVPSALTDLDRMVVAALQVNPRASWNRIARALGVSESTVSRRANRLLAAGEVRVSAVPDPIRCGLGFPVLMQLECAPGAAESVAEELAGRADVRFLAVLTGGFDLVLEAIVPTRSDLSRILVREFNQVPGITRTTTAAVIRNFKTSYDWSRALLGPAAAELDPSPREELTRDGLDEVDRQLIQLLSADARASAADLAEPLGVSESSVRRRVEALAGSGTVHFGAFVEPARMGFDAPVFLWLDVELSALEQVAAELGRHPEVRYLSATAGATNIAAEVVLADLDGVYDFMTGVVGTLPGIRRSEVTLEVNAIKRGFHTGAT
jgi:DNA-binding Lrp family transcriptional regulator